MIKTTGYNGLFRKTLRKKVVFSKGIFSLGVCTKNLKLSQSDIVTVVLCFSIVLFLQKNTTIPSS